MNVAHLPAAMAVLLAYALLCTWVVLHERQKRAQALRDAASLVPAAGGSEPFLVAFASQTGFAEELAWHTARLLHTGGVPVQVLPLGAVGAEVLARAERALFIVSTYGEGDAPDNAARFTEQLMGTPVGAAASLPQLHHAVLALGDSSYANFCGFGRRLDAWLQVAGATPLFERVELDNADPAALTAWQHHIARLAGTGDLPDWQAPAFDTWRLAERRLLNEGSAGAPVFHLELVPDAGAALPSWEAGDLVQVQAPGDARRPREYTVSSLPADGRVHLLVRQERHADGTLGVASGWLTAQAAIGDVVPLRLRAHSSFRIGDNAARPLVLIGNGTGLAGLRAHLKARAAQAHRAPVWLLYGERSSSQDRHFGDEIDAWVAQGVVRHADLVFSRDQPERRYVQHRLLEEAQRLRDWVAEGAALYVCGSLEGMAQGVDDVLVQALGADEVASLSDEGRYRRDVY
jgi:sulfite reductase (NADPH) flavoprotein alpha-component